MQMPQTNALWSAQAHMPTVLSNPQMENSTMNATVFAGGSVLIDPNPGGAPMYASAVAFQDGRVVALGDDAEALGAAGQADVIDLQRGVLAPALGEGHAHPGLGGLEDQGPAVRSAGSLPELLDIVRRWKEDHPDDPWIVGASYDGGLTDDGHFDAQWLDEATGDTPTVLRAWNYHTAWVNTAALERGGITSETPDPPRGRIVRRPDGSPLGTLQEAAANDFLVDVVPAFPLETRLQAIEAATRSYAAQGTSWVQDAWVEPDDIELYRTAATRGLLHTRVNLAQRVDPAKWPAQLRDFQKRRTLIEQLRSDRLMARTVKFFVDGLIENHTASMLEPFADRPHERGLPNWTLPELAAAVRAFDTAGFQIHLHAIGDAATRHALDALEAVIREDPGRDRRPVIAHAILIHPDDLSRFHALNVVANFEPYWAQRDTVTVTQTIPILGSPRDTWQYRFGSVARSGGRISFGSDWPVSTKDWRLGIATAVSRRDISDADAEPLLPGESVDTATAYDAYARGCAYQAFADQRGSLALGQEADAVWLSADPLTTQPEAIPDIDVLGTWIAGERVF
jgi:predicted amidohydrolase YtcJ